MKPNETTYMSVSLHSEHVQPNVKHTGTSSFQRVISSALSMFAASRDKLVIKLSNQISDNEHIVGDTNQNDLFISYEQLKQKTATGQYLRDDTLFFEVLKLELCSYT